ncbi:MAG: hypothetical protein R6U10_04915 [Thermoplasmatota archaeon]
MSEERGISLRHMLLLLFVVLSACSVVAVALGLLHLAIAFLVAALVFLAVLVACLLIPLFTRLL